MDAPVAPRRLRKWPLLTGAVAAMTAAAVGLSQLAHADTLFSANFEDSNIGSWSKSGGTWSVVSDGSLAARQSSASSENARIFNGSSGWTNYTVQARVKPLSLASNSQVSLLARASGSTTFYRLALLSGNRVQLQAVSSGSVTVLGSVSRTVATGTWYTLAINVNGTTVRGTVDGTQVASATSSVVSAGRIGMQTLYASASFDDVSVTTGGTTPTTAPGTTTVTRAPSTTRPATTTAATRPPSTTRPPATTRPPVTSAPPPSSNWPTKTGDAGLPNGTISVSGTFDGGMRRYCCIGDGGQSESQDPVFELANGATIQNVIIGAPAGDGIHCLGTCTIRNVWWEDVGEDAATFLGTTGGTSYVIGGGVRSATDKAFQHNGNGTVNISGLYAENVGKVYRGCGNCTNSYQRHVVMDNVTVRTTKVLAGININWGDTARFTRITVYGTATICDKYHGVPKGSEPTKVGSGADGVNCFYNASDITIR